MRVMAEGWKLSNVWICGRSLTSDSSSPAVEPHRMPVIAVTMIIALMR
jgi:hypothetical protein